MDLIEIRNSKKIATVAWAFDLFKYGGLEKATWKKAETMLRGLLDKLISIQDTNLKQEDIQKYFDETVSELETLLGTKPLDEGSIFEYGGLNCLFAEIMEAMGFPVEKGKYYWKRNFVYGVDFEEDN